MDYLKRVMVDLESYIANAQKQLENLSAAGVADEYTEYSSLSKFLRPAIRATAAGNDKTVRASVFRLFDKNMPTYFEFSGDQRMYDVFLCHDATGTMIVQGCRFTEVTSCYEMYCTALEFDMHRQRYPDWVNKTTSIFLGFNKNSDGIYHVFCMGYDKHDTLQIIPYELGEMILGSIVVLR